MSAVISIRMHCFVFAIWSATIWPISQSPAQTLSGTSAVAVYYPDAIVIGADSKAIWSSDDGSITQSYECKIHILNNALAFCHAGVSKRGLYFDVQALASAASKRRGTFSSTVSEFKKSATEAIFHEMLRINKDRVSTFATEYLNKKVFQILFVGMEGDALVTRKQTYSVIINAAKEIAVECFTEDCPPCGLYGKIIPLGGTEALRDSASITNLLSLGPIHTITSLISLDAILSPSTIATPIDILLFTYHGPLWLQKKTECN